MIAAKEETLHERTQRTIDLLGGSATAEQVVQFSAKPDAPLHESFEWDDSKAGHQYRLQQARRYISLIVIEAPKTTPEAVTLSMRKYVAIQEEEGLKRYRPILEVALEPDKMAQIIEECRAHLMSVQQKFAGFLEVSEFSERYRKTFGAIEEALV